MDPFFDDNDIDCLQILITAKDIRITQLYQENQTMKKSMVVLNMLNARLKEDNVKMAHIVNRMQILMDEVHKLRAEKLYMKKTIAEQNQVIDHDWT